MQLSPVKFFDGAASVMLVCCVGTLLCTARNMYASYVAALNHLRWCSSGGHSSPRRSCNSRRSQSWSFRFSTHPYPPPLICAHHLPYDVLQIARSIAAHNKTFDHVNAVAQMGDIMLMALVQTAKHGVLGGTRSTTISSGRVGGVGGKQMQALQLSTAQPDETWQSRAGRIARWKQGRALMG